MASARERNDNSYEDGGGFGKFRKRPFRRVQGTPYDRPPTAIRNPSLASNTNNNNGWLSKLVDPAQRLITSGAHKLFASMFRKRLPPPPPPQPPEPEANGGAPDNQQEAVPKDPHGIRESAINEISYPASCSDRGGLTELELILKQKRFTRSEFDQLTALLQSKVVDLPLENQERISEVIPSKSELSQDRKEEIPITPIKDNGLGGYHISTPIANSSVLDEDVTSPAELAKAYMGSKPSKVSLSVLSLRGRPVGEDSITMIDRPFSSKSPILSDLPRSSGRVVSTENGFVTPRSRGRSAIYNMARTPYSRVHSTSILQGPRREIDAFGAPSLSSQSMWKNDRYSGSKQGALKRRSSVLDNNIGSIGPIRRIRQKSNLLPSSGTLSVCGTGLGSDAAQHASSSRMPALASETLTEDGGNSTRGSRITSIPSKSSEMASKILQQLDVLVSSRDKSPSKLSPSMLCGPALRSLENVDSSKFLETVQDNNRVDHKHGGSFLDMRDFVSQKKDEVEGKGPTNGSYDKSAALNGVDSTNLVKTIASEVKTISSSGMDPVAQLPPQKKHAFQMSAHEDYVELDDDDNSDKIPSAALAKEREKVDGALAGNKTSSAEAFIVEKPAAVALSQSKTQSSCMLNQKDAEASDGFTVTEKTTALTTTVVPLLGVTGQHAVIDNKPAVTSNKNSPPKESNTAASIFSFGDKAVSPKEPNGFPPIFDFNSKTESPVSMSTFTPTAPVVTGSMGFKFGISSDIKMENSSRLVLDSVDPIKPLTKEPESDKADNKNNLKAGIIVSSAETISSAVSTSTTGIFSFGGMPTNASSTNGYVAATPSVSTPGTALFSQNSSGSSTNAVIQSSSNATVITTTAANINGSSNVSASASTPSFVSGPVFKFGSSVVPSASTSTISATTGVESLDAKVKETSFGNLMSATFGSASSLFSSTGGSIFSGTSSAIKSTGSSIFDGTSAAASIDSSTLVGTSSAIASTGSSIFSFNAGASTSAVSNQSQGFNPFSAVSTQASSTSAVFATTTQSIPIQVGSSASAPPFGLTANTTFSSGSSLFSSSTSADKLFSSGATFGLTSSTSEANPVSSSSSTSAVFGSSFQSPKSSIFGSAFNSASSSTGFAFGASTASTAATSTQPMVFGSSTSASSGSVFKFGSPATASPSLPVFTTPNSSFTFGSSPSNNDQMNMEDSMAEDTVQATISVTPVFDQQPVAPPSSGFVFGSATPTGGLQFGSTAPSGGNPFHFGSQPNLPASLNQSPFLSSGSLEFNAGGSFSLGTGGDKSNRKFVKVKKHLRKK